MVVYMSKLAETINQRVLDTHIYDPVTRLCAVCSEVMPCNARVNATNASAGAELATQPSPLPVRRVLTPRRAIPLAPPYVPEPTPIPQSAYDFAKRMLKRHRLDNNGLCVICRSSRCETRLPCLRIVADYESERDRLQSTERPLEVHQACDRDTDGPGGEGERDDCDRERH